MSDRQSSSTSSAAGINTLLGVVAFIISYALHKSVWWAILHMFLGIFYVLYAVVVYNVQVWPAVKALFGI